MDYALAEPQRPAQHLPQHALSGRGHPHVPHGQLDIVLPEPLQPRPRIGRDQRAVNAQVLEALVGSPFGQVRVVALARRDQRRQDRHAPSAVAAQQLGHDRLRRLRLNRNVALRTVLRTQLHEQQAQEMVHLGNRRHGALPSSAAGALLDGHRRRDAENGIHVRARRRLHELAGIGVERLQVAALPLGKQDVEGHRALAAAADPGDHRELVARYAHVDTPEVVLARVLNADGTGPFARPGTGMPRPIRHRNNGRTPQGGPRVALTALRHFTRRTLADDPAAFIAPLGAEIDDPVGSADDVQVVFDHDDRMPFKNQAPQRGQQGNDIVKMQPRRRFVEEEQSPLLLPPLARARPPGKVPREFEPLCLAAAQRGHGLTQLHVAETDRLKRLEPAYDLTVTIEEAARFVRRHVQHVGNGSAAPQSYVENLRAETAAVTVRTPDVDVAQELHFHALKTVPRARRAASRARVETERAGLVAAFARHVLAGKELAYPGKGSDVTRGVGACRLPDRGLVDQHNVPEQLVAANLPVGTRHFHRLVHQPPQTVIADVLQKSRFSGTTYTSDTHDPVERYPHVDALQVIGGGAGDLYGTQAVKRFGLLASA